MVGTAENFDAIVIGAVFSGMYMLKALRDKLGVRVLGLRRWRNRRRHLVLEPLPRGTLRFPVLYLLFHLGQAVVTGMGVVRTLSRAA